MVEYETSKAAGPIKVILLEDVEGISIYIISPTIIFFKASAINLTLSRSIENELERISFWVRRQYTLVPSTSSTMLI